MRAGEARSAYDSHRCAALAAAAVAVVLASAPRALAAPPPETPPRIHVELDPLPFVLGGYGGQVGYRFARVDEVRLALASFALEVPDAMAQLGGNAGFHLRVAPSAALYCLYFLSGGNAGWVAGGSARYLRLEYTHDASPAAVTRTGQLSLEAIIGYKWHPWPSGFYVLPWMGLSRPLFERGDPSVGGQTYQDPIAQPFATISLGWQLDL